MRRRFLTARWEDLVILNYEVPPAALTHLVPRGTELDRWGDRALISLVGFLFKDTRVAGLAIPGHRDFEEVNLRFYVRRRMPDGSHRRAVVFIRELVPRLAIATVARLLYNEPYLAVPMSHRTRLDGDRGGEVEYSWRYQGGEYRAHASVDGPAQVLAAGSEAEFVTEHYWGYTRQRDGGTLEYEVEHPPWRVWTAARATFRGPATSIYGPAFGAILAGPPCSAFVAEGSAVVVYAGRRVAAAT